MSDTATRYHARSHLAPSDVYTQLIPIIVPVLICALLGYGWARSGLPFEREFLTRIIMNIGSPCLILNGIANLEFAPSDFALMLGTSVTILASCSLIGAVMLRLAGQSLRSFLPPVIFGNTGNLGLPLCLFAFGDEGLGLAVAVYLVYSVSQFVFGPLVQGRESAWRTLATTPMIYAAVIGIVLLATDTPLPTTLANTSPLGVHVPEHIAELIGNQHRAEIGQFELLGNRFGGEGLAEADDNRCHAFAKVAHFHAIERLHGI